MKQYEVRNQVTIRKGNIPTSGKTKWTHKWKSTYLTTDSYVNALNSRWCKAKSLLPGHHAMQKLNITVTCHSSHVTGIIQRQNIKRKENVWHTTFQ